jgi:hypothetical protein
MRKYITARFIDFVADCVATVEDVAVQMCGGAIASRGSSRLWKTDSHRPFRRPATTRWSWQGAYSEVAIRPSGVWQPSSTVSAGELGRPPRC